MVDPRRTATAAGSYLHLQPLPGTDLALLSEGWATVTAIRTITVDESVELPVEREPAAPGGSS